MKNNDVFFKNLNKAKITIIEGLFESKVNFNKDGFIHLSKSGVSIKESDNDTGVYFSSLEKFVNLSIKSRLIDSNTQVRINFDDDFFDNQLDFNIVPKEFIDDNDIHKFISQLFHYIKDEAMRFKNMSES